MPKISSLTELLTAEPLLPYGSKAKIAKALGHKNRNKVQSVFRGLASEDLTNKVLKECRKILKSAKSVQPSPLQIQISKQQKCALCK